LLAAVGGPGARRELQATGEAVPGADAPVAARFALGDRVPVGTRVGTGCLRRTEQSCRAGRTGDEDAERDAPGVSAHGRNLTMARMVPVNCHDKTPPRLRGQLSGSG